MKKLMCIILAACMVLSLAACGGKSAETSKGNSSETPASTANGEALPGEGYKVGVIMANLTNSQYLIQANIYQEYLKEKGFEVMLTDCDNDTSTAVTAAENYATMNCDALIFSPLDDDVAISAAEAAKNINPNIVIVNSVNDFDVFDFTVMQDEYDAAYLMGQRAGEWINEHQGGNAEVGVIGIPAGSLIIRMQGFEAGVTDTVTGTVTFIEQTYSSSSGRTGYEIMEDLMTGFPDIRCVYGASDLMVLGAYEAVKASNVEISEYAFFGQDGTTDAKDALMEKSAFLGTVDIGSTALAYAIADVLIRLVVDGVDPDSFTVTIPAVVIDQTNADGFVYDMSLVEFTDK